MTDLAEKIARGLPARRARETRFRWYGRAALGVAFAMLAILLGSLILAGIEGFRRSEARIELTAPADGTVDIAAAGRLARDAWTERAKAAIGEDEAPPRSWLSMLAPGYERAAFNQLEGQSGEATLWLPLTHAVAVAAQADDDAVGLSPPQQRILRALKADDALRRAFHRGFLTDGDSRAPEKAGMASSIVGSLWVLLITMAIALPIGIFAAIYLEEFSRKGRLRDFVEVNINNLAAVPSIVYGLLGLAVYLGLFGVPRSSALAGGLTLALLILPVIIITTRASLAAVPPSIKSGALALGASPLQVVWHHTFPLALPGILTGIILGVARALGETAPLIMIGMVAFIADIPRGPLDPASAMPVQVYLWASSPEAGFADKTASGILVLLVVLLSLNLGAIILRRKTERRW